MDRERYEMEAATLMGERIATLRNLTFERASELPEAKGEETLVGGRKCMLTTFRQLLRQDEILVTVQLARPVLFGLAVSIRRKVLSSNATRFGTHPGKRSWRPVDRSAVPNFTLERTAGSHALAAAAQRGR